MNTQLKFIKANPQAAFVDTLFKVLYNNNPLAPIRIPSEQDLASIDPARCIEIYKNQFSNAAGFHFFIVGNVDEATLKPLIEKYIASLPVEDTKPMYKDNGLRPVSGTKVFKFYKGSDQKSLILSQFHGDNVKYSDKLSLEADLLGQVMTMEILDTIREKMAAIYSGGAYADVRKVPYAHYTVMVQLPCGPENVDKILTELAKEVKGFQTNGGPKGYLAKAQKATVEAHKESIKKNDYWASQLQQIMIWGENKNFFLNYEKEVNSITNKDIIETAKKLLSGSQFTAVSFPELTPAKGNSESK
jgi:zinc protease